MSGDRIDRLRALLDEEPTDRFLRYALALEHRSRGELHRTAEILQLLVRDDPGDVPAQHQLALCLLDLDRLAEAVHHCSTGLAAARAQGDTRAQAELRELLEQLTEGP